MCCFSEDPWPYVSPVLILIVGIFQGISTFHLNDQILSIELLIILLNDHFNVHGISHDDPSCISDININKLCPLFFS